MESISSRPLAPPRAPRRSTQIHCWPPAGFYCSCPSSPCRRRRAKKRNGGREGGTVYTAEGKNAAKVRASKRKPTHPSIFVLSPSLCPLSIFLQVLNLAKVRFIPSSSPILSGIGAECRTRRREGRREGEQQRNWMTHSSRRGMESE